MMKTIYVAAAIIVEDGKILATQRGYGDYKGWWEFPGGKLEEGESSLDACRREVYEELGIEIGDEELLISVEWDYPKFHMYMDCFTCDIAAGSLEMREHDAMRWLGPDDIDTVKWLPSDEVVVEAIKRGVFAKGSRC